MNSTCPVCTNIHGVLTAGRPIEELTRDQMAHLLKTIAVLTRRRESVMTDDVFAENMWDDSVYNGADESLGLAEAAKDEQERRDDRRRMLEQELLAI